MKQDLLLKVGEHFGIRQPQFGQVDSLNKI